MQVYVEDAILNTVFMDMSILFLTNYSLKQKLKFLKMLWVCLIVCIFNLFLNYLSLNNICLIVIKFGLGLIVSSICVENFSFKNLFIFFLVFLSFTFLIGGFCFAIYLYTYKNISLTNLQDVFINKFSGLISLGLSIYIYLLICLIKLFYKKQKLNNYFYDLQIQNKKQKINLKGYLDSGNILIDDQTSLPVIIINLKTFFKLFKNINIMDILGYNLDKKMKGKYINCKTITNKNKIFVFEVEKIILNTKEKKEIKALLGVSVVFDSNVEFDALLNPQCI